MSKNNKKVNEKIDTSDLFIKLILGEYSNNRKIAFKAREQDLTEEEITKISGMNLPKSEILLPDIRPYTIEIVSGTVIKPSKAFECLIFVLNKYSRIIRNLSYLQGTSGVFGDSNIDPIQSGLVNIVLSSIATYKQIEPEIIYGRRNAIDIGIYDVDKANNMVVRMIYLFHKSNGSETK